MSIYVASNLKHLRNISNKTLKEVAKELGVSDVAIHYWEKGSREPGGLELFNLAKYYNVSIDDLIKKDLRFEEINNVVYEEITQEKFMNEVFNMLDKVNNISNKDKDKIRSDIKYICGDDE